MLILNLEHFSSVEGDRVPRSPPKGDDPGAEAEVAEHEVQSQPPRQRGANGIQDTTVGIGNEGGETEVGANVFEAQLHPCRATTGRLKRTPLRRCIGIASYTCVKEY